MPDPLVSSSDLFERFPELRTADNIPVADVILQEAETDISDTWGCHRERAIKLLAAHRLARRAKACQSPDSAALGPITSISASQNSQSFSFAKVEADDPEALTSTQYGVQLLALRKQVVLMSTIRA